ncbi:DeoR family transcriptional regulator [Anaerobacterium chartisolvens]|uniref:DeoR family transcriptional regulator n=1 Tax=Anaerobacterium chartisolvens TaxID=1297424 RepID=A0A369BEM4_9FIRM|nr:DeoR/GlpR family DNA-binding transcription regulator [Anaerobacterium chartisolvens]RCX19979.1 DeoR family transcriptional regulator [Anaerobacterium chartisolvens]
MPDLKINDMSVDDRRKKILELLNREGKVKVVDLSRLFGISEVTIRNDLSELENTGVLERVHGGAVSTGKAYYNMSFHDRMKTNEDEKRKIAIEVASLISDGDTVMINSGTTTLFTVQELKGLKNLTIVTNSLSVAEEIGHFSNIHVILLGGNFNPQYQFTYGDDTINQLKRYKADKLILAADGVSVEEGITTYHHLEVEVNRQMIARVNKTIVVVDYTKIGRAGFARIDSLDSIDLLVSNQNSNQNEIALIREKGIEIRLV